MRRGQEYSKTPHMSREARRGRRQTKPKPAIATMRHAGKNKGFRTINVKSNGNTRKAATEAIPSGTKQSVRNRKRIGSVWSKRRRRQNSQKPNIPKAKMISSQTIGATTAPTGSNRLKYAMLPSAYSTQVSKKHHVAKATQIKNRRSTFQIPCFRKVYIRRVGLTSVASRI